MPSKSVPESAVTFADFSLHADLLSALSELGYEEPTPIQKAAIPALLEGRDVLGQAATGTGKTAAFALPLLQNLRPGECGPFQTSALILVPTRELAVQVAEAVFRYGKKRGVSVLPIYGGQEIGEQLRRLKRGIDVVIATPGRALDHLKRKSLKLDRVERVVLDEADEMLDMGFAEDLDQILAQLPPQRQTALFSATLAPRIAAIANRHLKNPVRVQIAEQKLKSGELPKIRQTAFLVPKQHKALALGRILDVEAPTAAIVFCRTRTEVDQLTESLSARGYGAAALHGGMSQEQRDRVLKRFKSHQLQLLVATDVAARGLHVEKLSHVVNYDLPTSPDVYVHRIGRTGRAGKEGVALSLVEPREQRLLKNVERAAGRRIEIASVPTVVDLQERFLESTKTAVMSARNSGDLDTFLGLVEQLSAESTPQIVAAAAIKALHAALTPNRGKAEEELPALVREVPARAPRSNRDRDEGPRRSGRSGGGNVRVSINVGRSQGVGPGDIVGCIANEAKVAAKEVGTISMSADSALVEVPERLAERIVAALSKTTLRGHRIRARLASQ